MSEQQQPDRAVVPVQAKPVGEVDQLMTLARAFAESGYFADARGWAQAVVKIQAGRELGFGPMASMVGIHIIKGKVTLSANLIASAIRRSGRYDYRVASLSDQACELIFFVGGKEVGASVFTMDDARKADISKGDNWKHYPRNMLFARAISNGAKWYCPDIFTTGVYTDGELDDQPEPVRITAQVQSSPGRSEHSGYSPEGPPTPGGAARADPAATPPRPAPPAGGNGHGKLTPDEAAALADLKKQLCQGRGLIEQAEVDALWASVLARWGVKSASQMSLEQRKQLVSYLVTQIQTDQMQEGLRTGPSSAPLTEEDAAAAAAGGH